MFNIFGKLLLQGEEFDPDIAREFASDLREIASPNDLLGIPLIQKESLLTLGILFAFNLLVCWVIVHFFYYRKRGRKDYYYTFMLFSITVFLLMFLLNNVNLGMGFALGLFAIFGMIRYRTEMVPIREMTYLFVIIGIAVINGLAMTHGYVNLLIINLLFIVAIAIVDGIFAAKKKPEKIILYDKIELVKHGREDELKADLEDRTGLKINKLEVGHIDFLRDVAYIKIFYEPISDEDNSINMMVKPKDFIK
ncbi:MAG: DUF4956 domain-containing protein [Bacteroidales bacterium]|nr:DUF4956 domain-containing protein [Bacteroidales bacterium]